MSDTKMECEGCSEPIKHCTDDGYTLCHDCEGRLLDCDVDAPSDTVERMYADAVEQAYGPNGLKRR